ncbi:MAG: thiamine-binding protein [Gracilibacteraceae bacterium]|nr:thiamine-binding protein [Gracilibacteraceae bacterium]
MVQPEASIAIQILPQTAEENIIPIVDRVIAHIKNSGLNYSVGPFETTVEGDFNALWKIAAECHYICLEQGAAGVNAYIKTALNTEKGVWSIEKKCAKHNS